MPLVGYDRPDGEATPEEALAAIEQLSESVNAELDRLRAVVKEAKKKDISEVPYPIALGDTEASCTIWSLGRPYLYRHITNDLASLQDGETITLEQLVKSAEYRDGVHVEFSAAAWKKYPNLEQDFAKWLDYIWETYE